MKILVTGAGALLGQGIIKSLRLALTDYHIIAVDPDPRGVGLFWADTAYVVPKASDGSYLTAIERILVREKPDAVLIGTDVELGVFAESRSELEARYDTHIVVSPVETIAIADDKWLTYTFLRDNGIPRPRTALPESVESLLNECDFPLVVKPRRGARSVGVHLVKNMSELQYALLLTKDAVIQECVATPQEEFTSGLLVFDGDVKAIVTMRRDLRDGNTYRAYVQPECLYNEFLAHTARMLHGYGPINLQFRVDHDVPKIFEINARFSGTTPLRAYAGFNEVDYLVRNVVLGEPIPSPALEELVVLRYWDEVVVRKGQIIPDEPTLALKDLSFERPFDFCNK